MSRSLVKNSAIYSLGSFLNRSLGFLLIPLYTRYLSVSEYGTLALLNLILHIVTFICLLGIGTAAMRAYYDTDANEMYRQELYGNAMLLLIVFPVLVLIVLGPLIWYLTDKYLDNIAFFPLISTMLLIGLLSPIIKLMTGLLRVQRKPMSFVAFNVGFFLFQTMTIVVAVAWLGYGLKGQVYSQFIANAVFAIIAVVILYRYGRPQFTKPIAIRLLKFGIPLVPFFIFVWLDLAAGRFVLEHFSDLKEVGIFALAAQFSGLLLQFAAAMDAAMTPHFLQRASQHETGKELGILVSRYLAFFGLMSLGVVIAAPPTIIIIATPEYYGATQYVAPLVLASWLFIATKPIVWSLTHSEQTGLLSTMRGISAGLLITLLLLFVGYWGLGILGVSYAMICANLLFIIGGYLFAGKSIELRMPWNRMGSICVMMLVAGFLLVYIMPERLEFFPIILQSVIFVIVTIATMKLAGIPSIKQLIRPGK